MFVPKIPPRPKSKMRRERSVPQFRRWIKKHICSVPGCGVFPCDPAHIRAGLPPDAKRGGTGLKPHDAWIIPLCRAHHDEQGAAELKFNAQHKLDPYALSQILWDEWLQSTDAGRKWRLAHAT